MPKKLVLYVNMTYTKKVVVTVSKRAKKSLDTIPKHIAINFFLWRREIETNGLFETQKIPGYHDEPLHGKLKGIRSVRLGLNYRAYYRLLKQKIECVHIEEVNKHDYKAIERLFR